MGKLTDLVIHQSNICRVNGNIAAHAAHGNAYIGFFQRRSIVNAVADHTYLLILFLILPDPFQLILRPALIMNLIYVDLTGNVSEEKLAVLMESLEVNCESCRLLGAYRAAREDDHA